MICKFVHEDYLNWDRWLHPLLFAVREVPRPPGIVLPLNCYLARNQVGCWTCLKKTGRMVWAQVQMWFKMSKLHKLGKLSCDRGTSMTETPDSTDYPCQQGSSEALSHLSFCNVSWFLEEGCVLLLILLSLNLLILQLIFSSLMMLLFYLTSLISLKIWFLSCFCFELYIASNTLHFTKNSIIVRWYNFT